MEDFKIGDYIKHSLLPNELFKIIGIDNTINTIKHGSGDFYNFGREHWSYISKKEMKHNYCKQYSFKVCRG